MRGLASILLPALFSAAVAPPAGGTPIVYSGNGHWYDQFDEGLLWSQAAQFCAARGGHLVTISSAGENVFVFGHFGYVTLGGTDAGAEGSWRWVNGEPWSYAPWDEGEPNNCGVQPPPNCHPESVLTYSTNPPLWNDVPDGGAPFVCEWEESPLPPTAGFTWTPETPAAGEPVQLTDTSTGAGTLARAWDFDGDGLTDSTVADPVYSFAAPGPHDVTLRTSNAYGEDLATGTIPVTGDGPAIVAVRREFPGIFLEGIDLSNRFDLEVDWQGEPGTVEIAIDGGPPLVEPGDATGAAHVFDLGADFAPGWSGSEIALTAINGDGVRGETVRQTLFVFPHPAWLRTALSLGGHAETSAGDGVVRTKIGADFPRPHLRESCTLACAADPGCSGCLRFPDWVPYLGGTFDLLETFGRIEGEVSSDGTGSLAMLGQTGFFALQGGDGGGRGIQGRVSGRGRFRLWPPEGLELTGSSFDVELRGTLQRSVGLVEAIPQLATVAGLPVIRWFNERAELTGQVGVSAKMLASFEQASGALRFREATGRGTVDLRGTLEVDVVPDRLSARAWVAGSAGMTMGVPAPLLRQVDTNLEAGVAYEVDALFGLHFEQELRCRVFCSWDPWEGTRCPADCGGSDTAAVRGRTTGGVRILDRAPPPAQRIAARALARTSDPTVPASVNETVVIEEVFEGGSPALAAAGGATLLLWEERDPADPTLQSTEIAWSLHDGAGWSAPAWIADDTRVELSPQVESDGTGAMVAAWLRVADPAFDEPIETTDDLATFYQELEVVTATFDPASGTWSTPVALTDDTAFDTDLHLSSDGAGGLMLSWLANPDGRFLSTTASPSVLRYSIWDGTTGTWSAPAPAADGLVGVARHAAAFRGDGAFVTVGRDPDRDLEGDRVLDLYTWSASDGTWSGPTPFTAVAGGHRAPVAAYDGDATGHLVWLRGDELLHATLDAPSPEVVRPASGSIAYQDVLLLPEPGGALTLIWQEVADSGAADLFARILDPATGTWSSDRRLTTEPEVVHRDADGLYDGAGMLRLAHLATHLGRVSQDVVLDGETYRLELLPVDGPTELRLLEHSLIVDLAVADADLEVEPAGPEPGDTATATLTVHNAGDFAVGEIAVHLYAGDPGAGGSLVASETLSGSHPAGGSFPVTLPFEYPLAGGDLVALVDPDDVVTEIAESNNRATLWLSNRPPAAAVIATPTRGVAPLEVAFDATNSYDPEGDPVSWTWAFGDGSAGAAGPLVAHTFADPGRYAVTAGVRDPEGAVGTAVVVIEAASRYPACSAPYELSLSRVRVEGDATYEACLSISTEGGFEVTGTGRAVLRAGEAIALGDGFRILDGGSFRAEIDPALAAD